ncbi:MAG TPA: LamG domain-containing protein, partial [Sedimentisphaerales bacterium]|nr:LamG domain-containing protein [Sedimentisphaerales bacterium]
IDGALSFDGTTSYRAEIPGGPLSASAGTITLWARPSGTQFGARYFFGHTSSSTGWADRIQLYMDNSDTQLDLGLGDTHTKASNIMTLSTDTWYHIALTWDSGDYVVYVDGQQQNSSTYTGLSTIGTLADIGNNGGRGTTPDEGFAGIIDEVRIYDEALDGGEVNDIYEGVIEVASSPNPADEATNVGTTVVLSWTPGEYAGSHDVYLGTSYNSVADANYSSSEYKGNFDTNSYDPNGLGYSTTYYWAVDEVNDTSLWVGDVWSFTTEAAPDTTAPSPDPMTFATEPYATGSTSISMTGTTATDASGVEYYFECTAGGGNSSGWQDSTTYVDTGLSPSTQYTYRVKARDKSSNQNETTYSTTKSATTQSGTDPNLEAWWKFDETSGTSASDSSGNSHTGTLQNGASFTSGYLNNAVNFDGSNDRVACGTWNVTGSAITICCWFKADTFTGTYYDGRLVAKATSTAEADHTWMLSGIKEGTSNKRLRFRLKTGGTTSTLIATSGNMSTGTWYHGAAVYNGSTMKLYLNGSEVGSSSKSGSITTSSAGIAIGQNPDGAGTVPWDGLIDDVRIYDRALSQSELEDLAGE